MVWGGVDAGQNLTLPPPKPNQSSHRACPTATCVDDWAPVAPMLRGRLSADRPWKMAKVGRPQGSCQADAPRRNFGEFSGLNNEANMV